MSTKVMQKRFSEEFKIEAVRQTTERGYKVAEVAARLGVSTWSLYQWRKQYAGDEGARREAGEQAQEVRHLKAELRRVTEERDILSRHRVARLMRENLLRSQTGYKRRPGNRGGRPSLVAENLLQQQFDVAAPDRAWVTDITYIRTHEGWLYLAVVLELFARTVVGWSMSSRIDGERVLNALLAAVWRRRPKSEVIIHRDQGSQFGSHDWRDFLKTHRLKPSMSRRGNCHDKAVAESFFQLLKRERIRRRVYATREQARADVFDYIEMFYHPKRRHGHAGDLSPVEFENQHFLKTGTV